MRRPYLLIGVCQRAHGVKGEVLVKSLTDDDGRFHPGLLCFRMAGADDDYIITICNKHGFISLI